MKKKLLKVVAMLFIGATCAFAISACGEKHTHTYTDSVTAPTCTAQGFTTHTCECGDTYVDSYVNSLGHNFGDYIYDNNATCLKDGTETAFCTRCSNESRIVVDTRVKENTKISHSYDQQIATQKYLKTAATCTNKAVYYYSCSCGAIGTESFEYGTTLNHTYNQKVAEEKYLESLATCTSKAKYYYSCTCGEVGTETFEYGNMLEHIYDRKIAESRYLKDEATCTSKALYYTSCACGAVGMDIFEYGDMREHVYDKEIAESRYLKEEATCTSKAVYYYSCICGDTRKTTTFQYGTVAPHAWGQGVETKEATCTQTGVVLYTCESCFTEKTETVQRKEHEITKKVIPATCSEPGYTLSYCKTCTTQSSWDNFTPSKGHSGSSYCYDCDKNYVTMFGEYIRSKGMYGSNDGGTLYSIEAWVSSSVKTIVQYYPNSDKIHFWVQAYSGGELLTSFTMFFNSASGCYDWTLMAFSSVILTMEGRLYAKTFNSSTNELSYNDVYFEFSSSPVSSGDTKTLSRVAAQSSMVLVMQMNSMLKDNNEGITIKDFGFTGNLGLSVHEHEWEQVGSYTKSTCTANGKVKYECVLDGCDVTKTETISAHGHVYNDAQEVQKASCTQVGIWKEKCNFCGNTKETTINKLPHDNESVITESTCTEQGYTTHTCKDCGNVVVDSYVDALGHETSQHYTFKEQSCTEKGIERHFCSRCDYYEDKTIPMDSHNYKEIEGDGGYITEQCSICNDIIAAPITYTITYELNGGTVTNKENYTVETETFNLNAPERTGYIFIGWTGTGLTEKTMLVTIRKGTIDPKMYTAHWELDSANVLIVENGVVTGLTDFGKTLSVIEIPSEINGVSIASVGSYAFCNCDKLTNVTIPDSVMNIGYAAFCNCDNLTSVTIGNSVTSITEWAFENCESLTGVYITDIVAWCQIAFGNDNSNPLYYAKNLYLNNKVVTELAIPDGVTNIGERVFYNCDSLTEVTFGAGSELTSISDYAFSDCSRLTNVVIPDSVTSIGEHAFYNCDKLTSVMFGESSKLTSIGDYAFSNCWNLTSVVIPDSVTSIGLDVFFNSFSLRYVEECGLEYLGNSNNPYMYLAGTETTDITTVILENDCKIIGGRAFYDCNKLTSVTIPDSVTSIGDEVFRYCDNLTSVVIGNSVTSIDDGAFSGCHRLINISVSENNRVYKSVDGNLYSKDGKTLIKYANGKTATSFMIPDGVTSIGAEAFSGCSSLASISIPDSVTSIGDYVFSGCNKLTRVVIPDSVTSIGGGVFSGCASLISVVVSDSVTSIGKETFKYCDNLTSVVIGNSVTSIDDGAFSGCYRLINISVSENNRVYKSVDGNLYSKDGKTLIKYANGKTATSFMIPDGVTSIGAEAFSGCSSLASISIPDSVTSIGAEAFSGCRNLTSISIPDSVTSIGESAFRYCSNLTKIYFKDDSNWYRTTSRRMWENKTGGTWTSVTTSSSNAMNFTDTYYSYYWYKL